MAVYWDVKHQTKQKTLYGTAIEKENIMKAHLYVAFFLFYRGGVRALSDWVLRTPNQEQRTIRIPVASRTQEEVISKLSTCPGTSKWP